MSERVALGRINGVWGTSGWVKVFSLTSPPENIFEYQPWHTDRSPGLLRVLEWRRQGQRLMARLDGVESRDAAERLVGTELHVQRADLPEPEPHRYYWHDLIGLNVENGAGRRLGTVSGLIDVGAHDVLQVDPGTGDRPILVPFVMDRYVLEVDPANGRLAVDWEPEWLSDTGSS